MEIKEKHYIKKCHCGTEIIYTRSDCHYDYHSDLNDYIGTSTYVKKTAAYRDLIKFFKENF